MNEEWDGFHLDKTHCVPASARFSDVIHFSESFIH